MKPVIRTRIIFAVYDICLVMLWGLITAYLHDGPAMKSRLESYLFVFLTFPLIWLVLSLLTRKFRIGERSNQREVFFSVIFSNFVILSVTTIIMVLFQLTYFSRFILFGTVAGITFFEVITGILYVSMMRSVFIRDWIGMEIPDFKSMVTISPPLPETLAVPRNFVVIRDSMIEETGEKVFIWISKHMDVTDPKNLILSTDTRFNIINHPTGFYNMVVNLHRINNLQRINKFFETVNSKLPVGGIFIGCCETNFLRKHRILASYSTGINYLAYTFDYLTTRVLPKLPITNKIYFLITGGKGRVISRTEALGRLYSCGFEILEEKTIGNLLYWKTRKYRVPFFDENPTYGIFIHLRRIGKNGREFKVYKLRTMHAYAEYVQGYVYEKYQLATGGKFHNDFRVSTLGKVLRKFWLDELPMFFNVLKGDMKIVGVRPLSKHYFSLYSDELQKRRILYKPGLIPPYYAQFPTPATLDEVQQNEMEYLAAYEKHPVTTDITYFFRAMYHIIWHRARSK
ncbi:MAG: sugar transferase [Bacteroidales bacterium]|nr:sugar transferase [Bacteroidales bacterium]